MCATLPNLFLGSWQENKVMSGDVSVEQDIQAPGLQEASRRAGGADAKISLMPHTIHLETTLKLQGHLFLRNKSCLLGHIT